MKTILITLLLTGLMSNTLLAGPNRPVKSATARKATTGKPLPPAHINRTR